MEGNVWQAAADDAIIVRYLLGQLPDAERDPFEDRYFVSEALHEQLQAIEEELVDAYVDGELTGEDLTCFERLFIGSPERERKIQFAKALRAGAESRGHLDRVRSISETRQPEDVPRDFGAMAALVGGHPEGVAPSIAGSGGLDAPPPSTKHTKKSFLSIFIPRSFGMQMAFGGVAAALIAGWITMSYVRREAGPSPNVAQLDQPVAHKSSESPPPYIPGAAPKKNVIKSPRPSPPLTPPTVAHRDSIDPRHEAESSSSHKLSEAPKILAFVLMPGTRSGGDGGNLIPLPSGKALVRLELGLETSDYDRYAAVVETADGNEVWKEENLTVKASRGLARTIGVQLRSDLLNPGDYLVKLSGLAPDGKVEVVAGYSFRVRRD